MRGGGEGGLVGGGVRIVQSGHQWSGEVGNCGGGEGGQN